MRVYDLAKEINMSSKELADIMKDMGIPVKNHMSALTAQQEKYFRNNFTIEKYKSGELSINKKSKYFSNFPNLSKALGFDPRLSRTRL